MSQNFIDQVNAIIVKNISDEKFGVSELASAIGLSTSQTLRKVKAATGKSANQYIRELRLEKAAKLIKKSDLSISEISYQFGFKSPSYFGKAFSKYYGFTPLEYKAKDISLNKSTPVSTVDTNKFSIVQKVGLLIALVLLCVLGYVLINKSTTKSNPLPNSIAVLPFKDLSPDDTKWFCDGVSDNILHSLAQMKEMTVTSFTSSSTYRDSEKQIPQIAKELGVNYILEGSVTLYKDKVKIIAQLINANDEHVWSKEYNGDFDDVMTIQNNVAQEVINQLKISLSPEQKLIFNKYPTDNMEAYALYLKGQFFNHGRYDEDVRKSFEYNYRAIELDSNFADAYAQLADNHFFIAYKWGHVDEPEQFKRAITKINKAFDLDPNSVKVNAVKARMMLKTNPNKSATYFKKALALNPNDAESHYWYSYYFTYIENPNIKQALAEAEKAHQLSPFTRFTINRYIWTLLLNDKNELAETILNKYGFVLSLSNIIELKFAIDLNKNNGCKELETWLFEKIEENPDNRGIYYFYLATIYEVIYLNKIKTIEYAKKVIDLNSNFLLSAAALRIIIKFGDIKEAEKIMNTDAFKKQPEQLKIRAIWDYHYYKKNYKKALKILKTDSTSMLEYSHISKTYAQMRDRKKLDSINKIYFINTDTEFIDKALVHAILKERDSMYFYLNKTRYTFYGSFLRVHAAPEFDPYRNEERFKAILKANHLPVLEE